MTDDQPSPAQAAADEINAWVHNDVKQCVVGGLSYYPGRNNLEPIIARHYAAQAAEVERLTRERDGLAELLKSEQATAGYAGAAAMRLNCCPKDVPDMVAGLQQQLAAVTAERDENIMSCEATYDEWKRMQKRAEAAEAESGLLTRSLERAMNWKDAAEAELAELEGSMTPEEAFEAWWLENDTQAAIFVPGTIKPAFRIAWLACSQHYEREIKAVAKVLDECHDYDAANLLRTRLLKGGE